MADEKSEAPLDLELKDEIGADLNVGDSPESQVAKSTLTRIADDLWHEIMSEWLTNSVRNTAVPQNVDAWNGLQTALPALKKLLEERL